MAFSDADVGESGGDGIDEFPELGVGDMLAGGGVDECDFAVVGAGRDKRRRIQRLLGWEWDWAAFAVEDFSGAAEAASWIHCGIVAAAVERHLTVGKVGGEG